MQMVSPVEENSFLLTKDLAEEDLAEIVQIYTRMCKAAEEIDYIEGLGGDSHLVQALGSDEDIGLTDNVAILRHGMQQNTNLNTKSKEPSCIVNYFSMVYHDRRLMVLLFMSIVAIVFSPIFDPEFDDAPWAEGVTSILLLFLSTILQQLAGYRRDRWGRKVRPPPPPARCVVVRGGISKEIPAVQVVAGDIVLLQAGRTVPADGIMLAGNGVECDEAEVKGDPFPQSKGTMSECIWRRNILRNEGKSNIANPSDLPSPVLLAGSSIIKGEGRMLALSVGDRTSIGKTRAILAGLDTEVIPTRMKAEKLVWTIGRIYIPLALIIWISIFVHTIKEGWGKRMMKDLMHAFNAPLAVVVISVPEWLGPALFSALLLGLQSLRQLGLEVRSAKSLDAAADINLLMTEKAGTLTEVGCRLAKIWVGEDWQLSLPFVGYSTYVGEKVRRLFELIISFEWRGTLDDKNASDVDQAIFNYLQECKLSLAALRTLNPIVYSELRRMQDAHTNSANRLSGVQSGRGSLTGLHTGSSTQLAGISQLISFGQIRNDQHGLIVVAKGLFESLYHKCSRYLNLNTGDISQIDEDFDILTRRAAKDYQMEGLQVYVVVYTPTEHPIGSEEASALLDECDLIFVCALGLGETIRKDTSSAVIQCLNAGIPVIMHSSDNEIRSKAIARDCGLLSPEEVIEAPKTMLNGKQFIEESGGSVFKDPKGPNERGRLGLRNPACLDPYLERMVVVSLCPPDVLHSLVVGLQEKDYKVAVVGLGSGYSRAWSQADLSICLASAGEAAKRSASIELASDQFAGVLEAVRWGRHSRISAQKTLQLQLITAFSAGLCCVVSSTTLGESVFSSSQLLWAGLIVQILSESALALELPGEEALLYRDKKNYLITQKMVKQIVGHTLYITSLIVLCIFEGHKFLPDSSTSTGYVQSIVEIREIHSSAEVPTTHFTYCYNIFIVMIFTTFINSRGVMDECNTICQLTSNIPLLLLAGILFTIHVFQIRYAGDFFRLSDGGLSATGWLLCIGFGFGAWIWSGMLRAVKEDFFCCPKFLRKDIYKYSSKGLGFIQRKKNQPNKYFMGGKP